VSKSANSTMTGILTLNNGGSGSTVANVQQKLNDLNSNISGFSTDISTLQSDVSDLQADVGTLEGQFTALEAEVDALAASSLKVEYRTITAGEEAAKQLTLAEAPTTATEVALDVRGGGAQFYTNDFTVSGSVLTWSGLGLDGLLVENDKVRIIYSY
jgi:prefoldin subunit 5